jgi:hypothetical protein
MRMPGSTSRAWSDDIYVRDPATLMRDALEPGRKVSRRMV